MVEEREALGHVEGMVVGEVHHGRAQPDTLGPGRCGGQKDVRRRDGLPARRVVLPNPELVEAELIAFHGQFQVFINTLLE